ncbi:hypothetical protein AVEN_97199-1 [Araneus ventricosus]|uniref:Uncharacterized protein n=1 Tax=Araneus ventricosus TaxID=182803 RepID=A0A4Y2DD16_ARAVE|nr:hypothetical protein AVEN_97199-1 [Araneus ventricosus]
MTGSVQAWTPGLGDHFGDFSDKSKITENAISLLGVEIYGMYWMIPCSSRTRVYKRRLRSFVCSASWKVGELRAIESAVIVVIRDLLIVCAAKSESVVTVITWELLSV